MLSNKEVIFFSFYTFFLTEVGIFYFLVKKENPTWGFIAVSQKLSYIKFFFINPHSIDE